MNNVKPATWREIVTKVGKMSEDEILAALNYEIVSSNRAAVVLRLHQRYTKVRMFRERDAIGKGELL